MRLLTGTLFASVLLWMHGIAIAQQPQVYLLFSFTYPNGLVHRFEVSRDVVARQPLWNPSQATTPPLAIVTAIAYAQSRLRKRYPNVDGLQPSVIAFERIISAELPDRWYYRIECDPVIGGQRTRGREAFTVVVLMDGTVIDAQPKKTP